MLEKTEEAIKDGHLRETGNIGHRRQTKHKNTSFTQWKKGKNQIKALEAND